MDVQTETLRNIAEALGLDRPATITRPLAARMRGKLDEALEIVLERNAAIQAMRLDSRMDAMNEEVAQIITTKAGANQAQKA